MSTALSTAVPALLRGAPAAERIKDSVLKQVQTLQMQGTTPRLTTVLVQDDPASIVYAHQKARIGRRLGIDVQIVEVKPDVRQHELSGIVRRLSRRPDVHGIMLELPLPKHLALGPILAELDPKKDVDGLTAANRMANMSGAPGLYPATPLACVALMDHYGIDMKGREVVLVGCGQTVGSPLFHELVRKGATVTVCTEHTQDLKSHLQRVTVAITAVGYAGLIQPWMVHKDLILIDAGMSQLPDGNMAGDVNPAVSEWVAAMTPTPGGIGTVTTMQLFSNLMHAISLQ